MFAALAIAALCVSAPSGPATGDGTARADEVRAPAALVIGARAPNFTFTDTRWLPRTLDDFGER